MEAIHIAVGRHGVEHRHRVNVRGQRQLHEDSVGTPVLVAGDRLHEGHQLGGCRRRRHRQHRCVDAHTGRGRRLALHVGGARGHVADEHHHEARLAAKHAGKRLDVLTE